MGFKETESITVLTAVGTVIDDDDHNFNYLFLSSLVYLFIYFYS